MKNITMINARKRLGMSQKELGLLCGTRTDDILCLENGRKPADVRLYAATVHEIAEALDINAEDICPPDFIYNNGVMYGDKAMKHIAVNDAPKSQFNADDLLAVAGAEIDEILTRRQIDMIYMRFGFNGKCRTLEEIATRFHITRERARQIIMAAIRKLQILFNRTKYRDFLN